MSYEERYIPGVLISLFTSKGRINGKAEVIKCNNTRAYLKAIAKEILQRFERMPID